VLWPVEPHTEAKHRLYTAYLDAWFPILLRRHWRWVTYAEGYAGPGEYAGGEPGSPLRALRAARGCACPPAVGRPARFLLVEGDTRRAEHLDGLLREELGVRDLKDAGASGYDVEVVDGDCETRLLPLLDRHRVWGQPLLVVLDTWGSAVPFPLLRRIAASRASEVIVTMQPQQFVRFARDPAHYGDRVFGPVVWRDVQDLPSAGKAAHILARYRDVVATAGFAHVLDFELADKRSNLLYLVYGTNHPTGVGKMKDAMWRVDAFRGIGYRDPRDPGQETLPIEPDPRTSPLRRLLLAHLETRERHQATLDQLRDYVLLQTVYRPAQTREVVKALLQQRAVDRTPARGQLSGATLVQLAAQYGIPV